MRRTIVLTVAFSLTFGVFAEEITRRHMVYFGNSLVANTMPNFHQEFGQSAGRDWTANEIGGAGWPLTAHVFALQRGGMDVFTGDRGDLTFEVREEKSYARRVEEFTSQKYDGMMLQVFGAMKYVTKTHYASPKDFPEPVDVGELPSAIKLIKAYLPMNPEGHVYIYTCWPPMESGEIPPDDQLPAWAKVKGARIKGAEFPLRDQFDYETEWLAKKYSPDNPDKPWLDNGRCRDNYVQITEGIKAEFPELWKTDRLEWVPVGDVFMALERKMKAGTFPGCNDIKDFYTDRQHIRIGLPRYTAAATVYAVLFKDHPKALDWNLYAVKEKYLSKAELSGKKPYDTTHDKGALFEMTPENVAAVNETIWEVITDHPYVKIR